MRISTVLSQQLGLNALLKQQEQLSKTQLQIASGLRVLTPADDPAAAVRTLDLQETLDQTNQYQDNISTLRARLGIEESTLNSAENVLFRTKELTIQALNSPLTEQDRLSIKAEIDQALENMVGIANTRNANGEYIYSGDLSNTPPVQWDGTKQAYVYQGGTSQRVLQIATDRQVADGDLAAVAFDNITSVSAKAGTQGGIQSIFDTLQTLSRALGQQYTVPAGTLTGDRFLKYGHDFSAGPVNFDLAVDGGGATTVTLAAGNYSSLKDLLSAVNSGINASGLSGSVSARANGNRIEFVSSTSGSASNVTISNNTDGFLTVTGFTNAQTGSGAAIGGSITGTNSLLLGHDYSAVPANFNLSAITGAANASVDITLNNNYGSLNAIVTDINNQITSAGQNNAMAARINGNTIEFVSFSNGMSSSIQINQQGGSFLQDAGFSDKQAGRLYDRTVNNVLTDIDAALDQFLQTRTSVGARMRALDDQESQHEKFVLDTQTTLSETRDLDYAEAISRFNLQSTALQAAQQAFSRVQNLSLFNFLR